MSGGAIGTLYLMGRLLETSGGTFRHGRTLLELTTNQMSLLFFLVFPRSTSLIYPPRPFHEIYRAQTSFVGRCFPKNDLCEDFLLTPPLPPIFRKGNAGAPPHGRNPLRTRSRCYSV